MELKQNNGVLFKNGFQKTDKSPDYTGELDVNGVRYKIAAWNNLSKSGAGYMSLKLTLKGEEPDENKKSVDKPDDADTIF